MLRRYVANLIESLIPGVTIVACMSFAGSIAAQSLPELPSAMAVTGAQTTARFYGGVTLSGNSSFLGIFQSSDDLSVLLEAAPESSHVGSSGKTYVLAMVGGAAFALFESGDWQVWDGTITGLGGAQSYSSLQNFNPINVDSVVGLATRDGVRIENGSISFSVYVAYDTSSSPGELYYSGAPLQFSLIQPDAFRDQALDIFASSISQAIVQTRCIACHVAGGIARATGLVFQRPSTVSTLNNFAVFESFLASRDDAREYILSKASGGEGHTGGIQLPVGGADYNNMVAMLDALGLTVGGGATFASSDDFFTGVGMQSNVATLRRAAIMLAGRAPSDAEIARVEAGDDSVLRSTLRGLMNGDGFHKFLVDGANDRLLVRGTTDGSFLDGGGLFHKFLNLRVDITLAERARGLSWSFESARLYNGTDHGLRDSPLELIAYVVENELSYSEILTADYMMLNPMANFSVDGTATFDDPDNYDEFQPGRMSRYYSWSESTVEEEIVEIQDYRILDPGDLVRSFPHAGILNTQSFLFRYPTTATNRNRARARWTFRHFLDVDIERSAQRTTDPVALADTNNPTMLNENCTVCHAIMDPVAGAFQNYADEGYYKNNGYDSLDNFYKYPEDGKPTLYQDGDTWYRDMRAPGIFDASAPDSDNSLQWLAQHIVQEPGFARAAVKFWWPSVIGNNPLRLPEVEEDATYRAQLSAYDAQATTIQDLANEFASSGMNLKDMLVELLMSPWFRAETINESVLSSTQATAHEIANLGNETLLTPERLAQKTRELTGFGWDTNYDFSNDTINSGLANNYRLYYGGIDSQAVTKRSTEMTPLMSTVAMTHALESACPIVLREFILPDENRRLFSGIDEFMSPLSEQSIQVTVESVDENDFREFNLSLNMSAGPKELQIEFINDYCDYDESEQVCITDRNVFVDYISIQSPGSSVATVIQATESNIIFEDCQGPQGASNWGIYCAGGIRFPFSAATTGDYVIKARLSASRSGDELANVIIAVQSLADAYQSQSAGAIAIRQKLIDLHITLLGKSYDINSTEIEVAYQLFVESWLERVDLGYSGHLTWSNEEQCQWWRDKFFFDDLPIEDEALELSYSDNDYPNFQFTEAAGNYANRNAPDPLHVKGSWTTIITYLLTHYHYLYE